jgi:translation initiation factor 4E
MGFPFLQHNSDDRPPPNKFLSIQSMPTSSFRPGFSGHPPTTAPSGLPSRSDTSVGGNTDTGFGNFGTGMGIGGQAWKVAGSKKA